MFAGTMMLAGLLTSRWVSHLILPYLKSCLHRAWGCLVDRDIAEKPRSLSWSSIAECRSSIGNMHTSHLFFVRKACSVHRLAGRTPRLDLGSCKTVRD